MVSQEQPLKWKYISWLESWSKINFLRNWKYLSLILERIRAEVGEIEIIGNRSRERRVWNGQTGTEKTKLWQGRLRHPSVNWDIWRLRSGSQSLHPCSQMSQWNTRRLSKIPEIIWLEDDGSGTEKQEFRNNITFTIENAFVICVLHYTSSIFDISPLW